MRVVVGSQWNGTECRGRYTREMKFEYEWGFSSVVSNKVKSLASF